MGKQASGEKNSTNIHTMAEFLQLNKNWEIHDMFTMEVIQIDVGK
jgi:hypothetical protein